MRLLNINTHSIIEPDYANKTKLFIQHVANLQPDIITMQEVNQTAATREAQAGSDRGRCLTGREQKRLRADNHAAHVAAELRALGLEYYWCWFPMKVGYWKYDEGLAIFSRKPIADTDVVLLSAGDDYNDGLHTRYALGIRTEGSNDWFYTVHMGWWNDAKESFADNWRRLQQALAMKRTSGKIFLAGDFNSPAAIRQEGYDLVKGNGWYDTYVLAAQKDAGFTVRGVIDGWRDKLTEAEMRQGMRIDYIWCSERIKVKRSRVCFNGEREPVVSDHFGVLADWEE